MSFFVSLLPSLLIRCELIRKNHVVEVVAFPNVLDVVGNDSLKIGCGVTYSLHEQAACRNELLPCRFGNLTKCVMSALRQLCEHVVMKMGAACADFGDGDEEEAFALRFLEVVAAKELALDEGRPCFQFVSAVRGRSCAIEICCYVPFKVVRDEHFFKCGRQNALLIKNCFDDQFVVHSVLLMLINFVDLLILDKVILMTKQFSQCTIKF